MIPDISLYLLYGALTVLMLAFTMLHLNPIGNEVYVIMYNDKEEVIIETIFDSFAKAEEYTREHSHCYIGGIFHVR